MKHEKIVDELDKLDSALYALDGFVAYLDGRSLEATNPVDESEKRDELALNYFLDSTPERIAHETDRVFSILSELRRILSENPAVVKK